MTADGSCDLPLGKAGRGVNDLQAGAAEKTVSGKETLTNEVHSPNPLATVGHQSRVSLPTSPGALPAPGSFQVKPGSRASDDRILDWIRKAQRGWSGAAIAERYGVDRSIVNRVLRQIRSEVGEL